MIKPGLCCIHLGLQEIGHKFNSMTWKKFSSQDISLSLKTLSDRIYNNVNVTNLILEDCGKRGWNYRASSDMFPCYTHPHFTHTFDDLISVDSIRSKFKSCADIIRKYNIRVSMHPGQFTVLCSANKNVVDSSIRDLNMHAMIMDLLETEQSYKFPINIHMGLYKGNLTDISNRFVDAWHRLSDSARKRLVIENEDKPNSWSVSELFTHLVSKVSIPITFDYHHHNLNQKGLSEQQAFDMCYSSWGNVKPLFHYSESISGDKNPRAHADYAVSIPNNYNKSIDVDWELKGKDLAISKSFKK